jgi:hypothetical protein
MRLRPTGLAIVFGLATLAAAPSASASAGADPVVSEALGSLTHAERANDFAAARALRRHIYRKLPVAGVAEAWIGDDPIRAAGSLSEAVSLFRSADQGVWCQAAAVLLARLYEASGYRAWVTSYGDPGSLTHTVTLVEIGGRLYVQDPYFNLEYVRSDGSPLPYYEMLSDLAAGRSPKVRQDLDFRLGLFDQRSEAQTWSLPALKEEVFCDRDGKRCAFAMTLARFVEVYYKRQEIGAFLNAHGEPDKVEFLMLHPLWTSGPHYPRPAHGAADIQRKLEAIARTSAAVS